MSWNGITTSYRRRLRWRVRRLRWTLRRTVVWKAAGGSAGAVSLAMFPLVAAAVVVTAARSPAKDLDDASWLPSWRARSDVVLAEARRTRADRIDEYAARYRIDRELTTLIHDAALNQGLDPELAFRLVRVESSFRQRAVGPAGAVGYAQVQPRTARWLDPTVTREKLFETETNLRIGFRYLRLLLDRYDGDTRMALLAYNRGPGRVAALMALGEDPANGYAARVLGRVATAR